MIDGAARRIATLLLLAIAAGCAPASEPVAPVPSTDDPQFEIVDILPRDAIPAIDDPRFWEGQEALENYPDDMLILGVAFDGQARAYSIPFLSRHEIVNDTVAGRAITVTW